MKALNARSLKRDSDLTTHSEKKLGRKEAHILNELLSKTQPYIKYEEKLMDDGGGRGPDILGSGRITDKDFGKSRE